jgi:HNH endonuclease
MILEDFVMLGTTVPEPNSDGRIFVCSAGVSPEYGGLVRLYPLARRNIPNRWNKYRVKVERNREDSRPESFKVATTDARAAGIHERINQHFEHAGKVRDAEKIPLLSRYRVGSIDEANGKRISLAIIEPQSIELDFEHNPASPDSPQLALFDDGSEKPRAGAKRFPFIPRLRFKDECRWWHLMLRDWGCYELMRKHPESYYKQHMATALHLNPSSSLFVGNMSHRRNAWLVISVLNHIREAPTLFDAFADDRPRISDKLRREVHTRDGWKCAQCGSPDNLTVDHKWPHSRGGNISLVNLQTLCNSCNLAKSDRIDGVV